MPCPVNCLFQPVVNGLFYSGYKEKGFYSKGSEALQQAAHSCAGHPDPPPQLGAEPAKGSGGPGRPGAAAPRWGGPRGPTERCRPGGWGTGMGETLRCCWKEGWWEKMEEGKKYSGQGRPAGFAPPPQKKKRSWRFAEVCCSGRPLS